MNQPHERVSISNERAPFFSILRVVVVSVVNGWIFPSRDIRHAEMRSTANQSQIVWIK